MNEPTAAPLTPEELAEMERRYDLFYADAETNSLTSTSSAKHLGDLSARALPRLLATITAQSAEIARLENKVEDYVEMIRRLTEQTETAR